MKIIKSVLTKKFCTRVILSLGFCGLDVGYLQASEKHNLASSAEHISRVVVSLENDNLNPVLIDFGELAYSQPGPLVRKFQVTNESSRVVVYTNRVKHQAQACGLESWFQIKTPSSISVPAMQTISVPVVLIPKVSKSNEVLNTTECFGTINIQSPEHLVMNVNWQVKITPDE